MGAVALWVPVAHRCGPGTVRVMTSMRSVPEAAARFAAAHAARDAADVAYAAARAPFLAALFEADRTHLEVTDPGRDSLDPLRIPARAGTGCA